MPARGGGASVLDNLGAIRAQLPTGAGGSPFALRFRSRRAEQRALAMPTDGIPPFDNLNANSATIQPFPNPDADTTNRHSTTTFSQPFPQASSNHAPTTTQPPFVSNPRVTRF